MKINLKDGFCVSCDRESGVLYHTCPYCGESVWHPLWRRAIRGYLSYLLPLLLLTTLAMYRSGFGSLLKSCRDGAPLLQCAVIISASLLLTPRSDKTLILASRRDHLLWLLNSFTASLLLVLCAVVPALLIRFCEHPGAGEGVFVVLAVVSAGLVPLALNSGWWRVLLAALIALSLLFV
ncbi:MAG: hypothetical protein PF904_03135 [Kiritimatiellae bacterium]|nr:hypothetical protein [Kiritimatiellia bacterium]